MRDSLLLRFAIWLTCVLSLVLASYGHAEEFPNGARDTFGPRFQVSPHAPGPRRPRPALDAVRRWNQIAVDASGLDHTPLAPGETGRVYGEQLGPGRASRAMAIVHVAIFEVVNAIAGAPYESYVGIRPVVGTAPLLEAAVATAAHDTLVAMFPSQSTRFDGFLNDDLAAIPATRALAKQRGIALGKRAASGILSLRSGDGSDAVDPRMGTEFIPHEDPGWWRQDPISQSPIALGASWGAVTPFVLASPDQFRAPAPPPLTSAEYARAYAEVKAVGGDGITTPTIRTADQTQTGIYWAYDGTPSLCAPPRLYNQITVTIAGQRHTPVVQLARLLALVNVAMADAGVAVWESKFFFQLWRPVTGIRESDPGSGPTGIGDGNADTVGDPTFTPLGAPASNLQGPNFTPPFPSYPSGHAGFGGALFEVLRRFYGTDRIAFTFVSDEFNGETRGNDGEVRPLLPRSFQSLSQAEEENGQSRIYLGIHWSFDKTEGIAQGRKVGDYVFDHAFRPRR